MIIKWQSDNQMTDKMIIKWQNDITNDKNDYSVAKWSSNDKMKMPLQEW